MRRSLRLTVEQLEARDNPTLVGLPWVDPLRLTVSFAPDGTLAGNSPSTLSRTLDAQVPTGTWRLEALRALQAWAVHGNVNIGLVADGGQALGTLGRAQGDTRFGDIRLAMAPLGPSLLASGSAFQPNGSTWSGDILLNSDYSFGVGSPTSYDLFSVVLHEAGHVFGLGDTESPTSVLSRNYVGIRTGLSPEDAEAFEALYQERQADSFDARQSNGSQASAAPLGGFSSAITGDITTLDDVDWYRFAIPSGAPAGTSVTIGLQTSGVSLLVPSLGVFDRLGNPIDLRAASSALGGDLTVSIPVTPVGGTYYIRVANATQSVFGIGSYRLSQSLRQGNDPEITPAAPFQNLDNHRNDTLQTAITLEGRTNHTRLDFAYSGSLSDAEDVDYYKVHSSAVTSGSTTEMIALVSASEANGLAPRIDVFDGTFATVPVQVLANGQGFFSVRVPDAHPDRDYYVKVSPLYPAGDHATGNYFLGVAFGAVSTVDLESFTSGTLNQETSQKVQQFSVPTPSAISLVLSAGAGEVAVETQVQMRIFDAKGNLVFQLVAYAGMPATSGVAYLAAGNYTVSYVAVARNGVLPAVVSFALQGAMLGDPIGPILVESTGSTTTQTETSVTTLPLTEPAYDWGDPTYLILAPYYPWIDPIYYF